MGAELMKYEMVLKWGTGQEHHLPDALSRLQWSQGRRPDIGVSSPDDTAETGPGREAGPQGVKLNGVLLNELDADYPEATADVRALAL